MWTYMHIYIYCTAYIYTRPTGVNHLRQDRERTESAYINAHAYTCIYIHMYVYTHVRICTYRYLFSWCASPATLQGAIWMRICIYIYIYVHMHTCMYIHMCVYLLLYTHPPGAHHPPHDRERSEHVYVYIYIDMYIYTHVRINIRVYRYSYTHIQLVRITRDTTESDLKVRRELSAGTALWSDQAPVRAGM